MHTHHANPSPPQCICAPMPSTSSLHLPNTAPCAHPCICPHLGHLVAASEPLARFLSSVTWAVPTLTSALSTSHMSTPCLLSFPWVLHQWVPLIIFIFFGFLTTPNPPLPLMLPWLPEPTWDHLRVENTTCMLLKSSQLHSKSLYHTQPLSLCDALLLVAPVPYLTTCPGPQCLELCSSGSQSPASKFDASGSLGQASAMPAGDGALLIHACQYLHIWHPVLGHFSKPGIPKVFKEDRCVIRFWLHFCLSRSSACALGGFHRLWLRQGTHYIQNDITLPLSTYKSNTNADASADPVASESQW